MQSRRMSHRGHPKRRMSTRRRKLGRSTRRGVGRRGLRRRSRRKGEGALMPSRGEKRRRMTRGEKRMRRVRGLGVGRKRGRGGSGAGVTRGPGEARHLSRHQLARRRAKLSRRASKTKTPIPAAPRRPKSVPKPTRRSQELKQVLGRGEECRSGRRYQRDAR